MNKALLITVLLTGAVLAVSSCSQQPKAANSRQAIEQSKAMSTTQEQAKYLVSQANAFVNSNNFDEAIQTAKYILANLDADSAEAKSIIEKAAAELKNVAMQKTEEMKKSLGNLGK